ncbi:MAG: ankyrin repeat domain-containing protein [Pseudomonadota bacterium]
MCAADPAAELGAQLNAQASTLLNTPPDQRSAAVLVQWGFSEADSTYIGTALERLRVGGDLHDAHQPELRQLLAQVDARLTACATFIDDETTPDQIAAAQTSLQTTPALTPQDINEITCRALYLSKPRSFTEQLNLPPLTLAQVLACASAQRQAAAAFASSAALTAYPVLASTPDQWQAVCPALSPNTPPTTEQTQAFTNALAPLLACLHTLATEAQADAALRARLAVDGAVQQNLAGFCFAHHDYRQNLPALLNALCHYAQQLHSALAKGQADKVCRALADYPGRHALVCPGGSESDIHTALSKLPQANTAEDRLRQYFSLSDWVNVFIAEHRSTAWCPEGNEAHLPDALQAALGMPPEHLESMCGYGLAFLLAPQVYQALHDIPKAAQQALHEWLNTAYEGFADAVHSAATQANLSDDTPEMSAILKHPLCPGTAEQRTGNGLTDQGLVQTAPNYHAHVYAGAVLRATPAATQERLATIGLYDPTAAQTTHTRGAQGASEPLAYADVFTPEGQEKLLAALRQDTPPMWALNLLLALDYKGGSWTILMSCMQALRRDTQNPPRWLSGAFTNDTTVAPDTRQRVARVLAQEQKYRQVDRFTDFFFELTSNNPNTQIPIEQLIIYGAPYSAWQKISPQDRIKLLPERLVTLLSHPQHEEIFAMYGAGLNVARKLPAADWQDCCKLLCEAQNPTFVRLVAPKMPAAIRQTTLATLVANNWVEGVRAFAPTPAELDWVDPTRGQTLLTKAIGAKELAMAETLIRLNPDPTNPNNQCVLHAALQSLDIPSIDRLIKAGAQVNAQTPEEGYTPLHMAIQANSPFELLAVLIENGAERNRADRAGNTPLHLAVKENALGVLTPLVDAGADINAKNHQGDTPSHLAFTTLGNSYHLENEDQDQALELSVIATRAIQTSTTLAIELIKIGANVNAANNAGDSLLHLAVQRDSRWLERIFMGVENEASIPDEERQEINDLLADDSLSTTLANGLKTLVGALIAAGANPLAPNQNGKTPLDLARDAATQALLRAAMAPVG